MCIISEKDFSRYSGAIFSPVGGAAWWREWPTGFEDIDDDHRLFAFAREMSGHVHQDWHDAE